jgi:TM2 domain-containing membrane protein YozV
MAKKKASKEKSEHGHNIHININNSQSGQGPMYNNGKAIVERNYLTALLLSIFLGCLGVDRFYVNHIGLGLLKLFTFGGFFVWWIIDIIMFATKNVRYVKWVE